MQFARRGWKNWKVTPSQPAAIDNADNDNEPKFIEASLDESDIFSNIDTVFSKARAKCSKPWFKCSSNSASW